MEKTVCSGRKRARKVVSPLAALIMTTLGGGAMAMDLNPDGEWQIRWDNTVKYSAGYRLKSPASTFIDPVSVRANSDDGDRSFGRGPISNRADLLSEFDVQKNGFGLRLSAAAWYDQAYNSLNDHNSPISANRASVPYNEFTPGTQKVAGQKAEMLDWFVFGRNDIGGKTLSYRLGQHSLIWGTSMFFGMNGIAKGMAPIDVYKLNIPGTQAKETTIPVPQLSSTLQLTDDTSLEGYVQFKYRPTRLHPSGSFLSTTDMLGDGAERMFIGNPTANRCGSASVPVAQRFNNCYLGYAGMDEGKKRPNFGLALNTRSEWLNADLGFYAISYRDTSQIIQTNTAGGTYRLIAPTEPVRSVGMSMAKLVGDANVGLELSARDKQPLAVKEGVVSPADPGYVTGRTAHMNLSWTMLGGKSGAWDGYSLVGELAANRVMGVDDVRTGVAGRYPVGTEKVNLEKRKTSAGMRVIFTPSWYQVAPGLDMSLPINLGWSFRGNSMIDTSFPFGGSPERSGELVLGVTLVYLNKWTANLSWINYLGNAARQPVLDRDYLRFSLQTTF
ncbi:Protein of unknown function (DUF1302) [Acidovorax sp. CF316]|uniref:DUF1302 domain-containing protein n=1 Tax=Acidovorax sp. CF316 TaxID=1144317 RepID=UPI00026BE557|nr:DUF1302 family protein [Acidovorax sp. CF316]EJE50520.1 Protein of unknown function (DUF1302) [Acidovorax sp. CF316]